MINYTEFRETNEWEGERWSFWLRVEGNETELEKLRSLLSQQDTDTQAQYRFTGHRLEEYTLDQLLVVYSEDGEMGYLPRHQKVDGTFTCPPDLGEYGNALYKGSITKFFEKEQA